MQTHASVKLPGLADVHVHLRVPGGEHKEDVRSGTAAALAGGFTTVLAMPNTHPPLVTLEDLRAAKRRAATDALCDVHYYAGASGEHIDALPGLADEAVGLKIYMDQTYGPLRVGGLATLMRCFEAWRSPKPIAVHAEGRSIAVAIGLAAVYGQPVHLCHVSRREEIHLIARAKERGLPVTCEVTPHHLFLTEADLPRLGERGDMRPRLASEVDREALWAHIDSTIDCVATDHAPHTLAEKAVEGGTPGVPGLETALPLMLTAVAEGRVSMARLVALMAENPRRIFGLPAQPDTWIEVDPDAPHELGDAGLQTKCGWTPFAGFAARGRLLRVHMRGRTVFEDDQIHPIG